MEKREHFRETDFEVMAPAGSYESLQAAIGAGADSVYFGAGELNMRAHSSANFNRQDIARIAETCRNAGVKSYLTLNTILFDNDLAPMRAMVDCAKAAGIDAIIASDPAVLLYAAQQGVAVQHHQCGGARLLCPLCRCGGSGARSRLGPRGAHSQAD